MNLQNIFDSTDFVHASGTKEELAVAEFLKGQCESLGVPAGILDDCSKEEWENIRKTADLVIHDFTELL